MPVQNKRWRVQQCGRKDFNWICFMWQAASRPLPISDGVKDAGKLENWLRERDIPCGVILNNALPQVGTEGEYRWWRPSALLVAAFKMGHSYRAQSDAYYLIHRAVNMQVVFVLIRLSLIGCTNKYIMISVRSLDMITVLMYYRCTNNNRLFNEINNWVQFLSKQNVSSAWISLPQC